MQIIFHVTIQNKSLEFPMSVPESVRSIGTQCMKKDPSERPTMKEVVERLEGYRPGQRPCSMTAARSGLAIGEMQGVQLL